MKNPLFNLFSRNSAGEKLNALESREHLHRWIKGTGNALDANAHPFELMQCCFPFHSFNQLVQLFSESLF